MRFGKGGLASGSELTPNFRVESKAIAMIIINRLQNVGRSDFDHCGAGVEARVADDPEKRQLKQVKMQLTSEVAILMLFSG